MQLVIKKALIYNFFIYTLVLSGNLFSERQISFDGVEGAILTPSARISSEGELRFSFSRTNPDRKIIINSTPFDWLEASFFYVDVAGKNYPGFNQSYKDKGFNTKIVLKQEGLLPALALGLNDFAGTGIYSSEYLVLSKYFNNFDLSFGMGWGEYGDGYKLSNPLKYINSTYEIRNINVDSLGGNFDVTKYFSGPATLFGSVKVNIGKNLILIAESNPLKRNERLPFTKKENYLNFGLSYLNSGINYGLNFIRGNEILFNISYNYSFSKYNPNHSFRETKNTSKNDYLNLIKTLNANQIGMVEAAYSEDEIYLKTKSIAYNDIDSLNQNIYLSVQSTFEEIRDKDLKISHQLAGMEVKKQQHNSYTQYSSSGLKDSNHVVEPKFKVNEVFPIFNYGLSLVPRPFIAAREGFFHGGLLLEFDSQAIFAENLFVTTNIKKSLIDNFDELVIPPIDIYPEQVRSDTKKYFNGLGEGVVIGRMQLDYLRNINDHYFLISGGIFEEMFSGYGIEYLYSKQSSPISFGLESFSVQKRDYSMLFDHQKYKNTLSRVNINLNVKRLSSRIKLSYGEYLAGDFGYTFEADRYFKNGSSLGFFFTLTDVPFELFGEGSFDKGIKFTIPVGNLFRRNHRGLKTYSWRPLVKDPGALVSKNLQLENMLALYRR